MDYAAAAKSGVKSQDENKKSKQGTEARRASQAVRTDESTGRQKMDELAARPSSERKPQARGQPERRKPNKDLTPGSIFIGEHSEVAGDRVQETSPTDLHEAGITTCKSHSQVVIKDRKYIVVAAFHYHYFCLPLYTYNGTGSRGRRDQDDHVSVHDHRSSASRYDIQSKWKPLQTEWMTPEAYILAHDACVRLTFPQSRPKNLQIECLGRLDQESADRLKGLFCLTTGLAEEASLRAQLEDPAYNNGPPPPAINTTLANDHSDNSNSQSAPATAPSTFGPTQWPSTPTPPGLRRRGSHQPTSNYPHSRQWPGDETPHTSSSNRPGRGPIDWDTVGHGRRNVVGGPAGTSSTPSKDTTSQRGNESEGHSKESYREDQGQGQGQDIADASAGGGDDAAWDQDEPWKGKGKGKGKGGRALKRVASVWRPRLSRPGGAPPVELGADPAPKKRGLKRKAAAVDHDEDPDEEQQGEARGKLAALEGAKENQNQNQKQEAKPDGGKAEADVSGSSTSTSSSRRSSRKRTEVQTYAE